MMPAPWLAQFSPTGQALSSGLLRKTEPINGISAADTSPENNLTKAASDPSS